MQVEKGRIPKNRRALVYHLESYGDVCPDGNHKVMASRIVADTLLAVNRLLLAEGIGLQVGMIESPDGQTMFCFLQSPFRS